MTQRKRSKNPGEVLRVRLTIPPDGVGVLDYLKGISPAGLNMEILQLVHLGYQFRIVMNRGGLPLFGQHPTPAAVEVPLTPRALSIPLGALENIQVNAAEPSDEGAQVASPFAASFKTMFAPAYERTKNRKAVA
jgi:hypothetical protein